MHTPFQGDSVRAPVAVLTCVLAVAGAAAGQEPRQSPTRLQGVWTAHSVSRDMGKTVDQIVPKSVATVYADKIKGPSGAFSAIEKVVETRSPAGGTGYLIKLSDGVVWGVTPKEQPGTFMLQIMSGDPLKEVIRFGVTVAREQEKNGAPQAEASRALRVTAAALRGVWTAETVSKDLGKTIERIAPVRVASVYATKVKGPEGEYRDIEKIVEAPETGGELGYLFELSDGVVWGVTPKKVPNTFMLQVMEGNPLREVIRFGVTVAVNNEKELREVKQVAPLLRGVWVAHRVSKDAGKTVEPIRPKPVATVHSSQVKVPKGDPSDIEKVVEVSQGQGALYLITLANGETWAAIEREKPGDYLLQILRGKPSKEAIRYEVSIANEK